MARSMTNPRPATLQKYYAIVDEWLQNGFNGAAAYSKVFPNANENTARHDWYKIKSIPAVQEYIQAARKALYEDKCIDLERVTMEIANMAFADKTDKYVPPSVKIKALEMLQRALREDMAEQAKGQDNTVVIELEDEPDESNTEEESVQ